MGPLEFFKKKTRFCLDNAVFWGGGGGGGGGHFEYSLVKYILVYFSNGLVPPSSATRK